MSCTVASWVKKGINRFFHRVVAYARLSGVRSSQNCCLETLNDSHFEMLQIKKRARRSRARFTQAGQVFFTKSEKLGCLRRKVDASGQLANPPIIHSQLSVPCTLFLLNNQQATQACDWAMSHDPSQSPGGASAPSANPSVRPRNRISHTKSRGGCYTCKRRRIKVHSLL